MKSNHILTTVVVSVAAFLAVGCASRADLAALEAKVDSHRDASRVYVANEVNRRLEKAVKCWDAGVMPCADPPDVITLPPVNSGW